MAQATRPAKRKTQVALSPVTKSPVRDVARTPVQADPAKATKRKAHGRMPQRSEDVSGVVDADGLTPVTAAQEQETVAKTKTSPKRANGPS
jgi:hypothetical protein